MEIMTNNDDVYFDNQSGISIEEQKEILININAIAEKNRKRLSVGTGGELEAQVSGKQTQVNAGKSGAFFPLVINITAAAVLCAGVFFLISFNGKMGSQLRTGKAVYNLTEKALIEDIRKDTAEKLAAKDMEMSAIVSRMEEVDAQLEILHSSNQELTAEQLETQSRLLNLQNSYREELAILQDERSKILENSRSREASLRAQLEERAREYSAAQQKTYSELDAAQRELEKLTGEQEKNAAINAYLMGKIALYGEAADGADQNGLKETNAQLEQTVADMHKTIEALSSGSTGQVARLSELEETVSALRASIYSLESSSSEKDRAISSLETERANLARTNQTQEQEIANLRNQIEVIRQALLDN